MASRNALLRYLKVNVTPTLRSSSITSHRSVSPLYVLLRRRFSEEVRGSFLDKSEVTDRVVSVVKTFQKVEPSKVISSLNYSTSTNLRTHLVWFFIGMIVLLFCFFTLCGQEPDEAYIYIYIYLFELTWYFKSMCDSCCCRWHQRHTSRMI